MNKKKLIVPLVLLLVTAVYFVFFDKDKKLKYIPENADVVALIDVKKLTGQYISSLILHPSRWGGGGPKDRKRESFKNSGVKIPDFLQVFHIKNTNFSEWYSVLELKDREKFIAFLKKQKFVSKGKYFFQKGQLYIAVKDNHCIAGTSDYVFGAAGDRFIQSSGKNNFTADQFIHNTSGSISFIRGNKIQNFSVELNENDIQIKNNEAPGPGRSIISKLKQRNCLLELELDVENIRRCSVFFSKKALDSISEISSLSIAADIEQVNDTIISYGYDDNFNEIEKKTYQKIIQPNYIIELQSLSPDKTLEYFQFRKWVNGQNQFTAIPFLPNTIIKDNKGIVIHSTRKPVYPPSKLNENYIFIRNNPLLLSSLKTLSDTEKRILSEVHYIFYESKDQHFWMTIKAKDEKIPLILRW
ncbi:hypothetical protein DRF59_15120 [Chryseobacterium flavum]|uniref:Uncharacterized protein n=1 Tax=Chryseobacterium flavum TaxID=415851 RepID=A0A3D9CJ62_9FLAO|nr:hypothetical protein [Chryseobacterium flavum]REC65787.1 hypothetical protein DRF59_15120 [Chryseobacterium flavum]